MRQAEAAVIQAEGRLRQLRLQLPVAAQSLRQAQANLANGAQYERNRKLFASGFIGQSVLDESSRNLDVAQTQVDTARKQVDSARPQGSDSALAVAALEQANAGLQAARARHLRASSRRSLARSSRATSSTATSCSRARR